MSCGSPGHIYNRRANYRLFGDVVTLPFSGLGVFWAPALQRSPELFHMAVDLSFLLRWLWDFSKTQTQREFVGRIRFVTISDLAISLRSRGTSKRKF